MDVCVYGCVCVWMCVCVIVTHSLRLPPPQCLPADTLAVYSISEQSRLDGRGLQELCPTMLPQLDAGNCGAEPREELNVDLPPRPTDSEGETVFEGCCSFFHRGPEQI